MLNPVTPHPGHVYDPLCTHEKPYFPLHRAYHLRYHNPFVDLRSPRWTSASFGQQGLPLASIHRCMRLSAALTPLMAQAFVLTRGTTHYRTEDRGQTWRSFEMPLSPSSIARPLSFHSDPSKYGYIIYQGTKCDREGGWSSICHDEVCPTCSFKCCVFLTTEHRRIIPRRRSQIHRNRSCLRPRSAPLLIVQRISSTMHTLI